MVAFSVWGIESIQISDPSGEKVSGAAGEKLLAVKTKRTVLGKSLSFSLMTFNSFSPKKYSKSDWEMRKFRDWVEGSPNSAITLQGNSSEPLRKTCFSQSKPLFLIKSKVGFP
jgi:hypothetical protein